VHECDACSACGDTCDFVGCGRCGGAAAAELDSGGGGSGRRGSGGGGGGSRDGGGGGGGGGEAEEGASLEAVAVAKTEARAAAVNPQRFGWGRGSSGGRKESGKGKGFTCCQVLRHRGEHSLWLVAGGCVYDATLFMQDHPVGPLPMLRGAGRDNTEDMEMHSGGAGAHSFPPHTVCSQCTCTTPATDHCTDTLQDTSLRHRV